MYRSINDLTAMDIFRNYDSILSVSIASIIRCIVYSERLQTISFSMDCNIIEIIYHVITMPLF